MADKSQLSTTSTYVSEHTKGNAHPSFSSWPIALPITMMLVMVTGTANMLLIEMINRTQVRSCRDEDCELELFEAPLAQQMVNALGQCLCLLIFYCDEWFSKWRHDGKRWLDYDRQQESLINLPSPSPYLWIFPALLDFGSSMMLLYALVLETASSVQILRTFLVVLCAILSVTYLHRDLRVGHWLGVFVMTIGLILTGWESVFASSRGELHDEAVVGRWLGVILVMSSTGLNVFQLVFEERLISNYRCSPFEGVGWTGVWELIIATICVLTAHLIGFERIDYVWYRVWEHSRLSIGMTFFGISTAIFTAGGLAVTKMGTALLTTAVTAMRQVPIWAIELAFRWTKFGWVGFFGMLLTCIGFITYNHLLSMCCCSSYNRIAMKEVRIRCSCHDEEISDDEMLSTVYSDDESAIVESVSLSSKKTTSPKNPEWKTAIITTKRDPKLIQTSDSNSAWIYVRRSEEWILEN